MFPAAQVAAVGYLCSRAMNERTECAYAHRAREPTTAEAPMPPELGTGVEIPRHWQGVLWRSSEPQALVRRPSIGLANSLNLRVSEADLC
jgi:hypothetical protein